MVSPQLTREPESEDDSVETICHPERVEGCSDCDALRTTLFGVGRSATDG